LSKTVHALARLEYEFPATKPGMGFMIPTEMLSVRSQLGFGRRQGVIGVITRRDLLAHRHEPSSPLFSIVTRSLIAIAPGASA
jgi:hypothetical protein